MREFKSARIYRIWVREFKMREFKSARIFTCANLTSVKVLFLKYFLKESFKLTKKVLMGYFKACSTFEQKWRNCSFGTQISDQKRVQKDNSEKLLKIH